jgi:hypothetical protein
MRSFIAYSSARFYENDQFDKEKLGMAYSTHGSEDECVRTYRRVQFGPLSPDG